MFTKVKVTQSMVDAVNSVISEKKMSEADLDETGLRKAAYAAHTAGQKMFSFKGKTYPVKVQGENISYGEAIEEAASGEVTKTKTGLIHKSTKAYGGSKPEKHVVDTLTRVRRYNSVPRGQARILRSNPLRTFPQHTTSFDVLYVCCSTGFYSVHQIQHIGSIPRRICLRHCHDILPTPLPEPLRHI